MNKDFREKVKSYLNLKESGKKLNEMALKHLAPQAEKKFSNEELKELFKKTGIDALAKAYVRNARADKMTDQKIVQGLGSTFRTMEDKDKAAKVKEAVKKEIGFEKAKPKKKEDKKEDKKDK